jgi:predicted metal-binding membrane protein
LLRQYHRAYKQCNSLDDALDTIDHGHCSYLCAWLLTYSSVQNMGLMMQIGVPMSIGMEGSATLASFIAFTGMWLVMMVAMMLPSSFPTLLLHRTVYERRTPYQSGGTFLFALSYFLVWTSTSVLFYGAYVMIGMLRAGHPGSGLLVLRGAGVALMLSGGYQWSGLKRACLKHCRSPLHFVMEHWHDGRIGAVRMGAVHGILCFGCCWGLMVILFVMGIMHLGWMAAVGALILLEKIAPAGKWLSNAIGAIFILLGAMVVLFPELLSTLSSQVTM